MEVFRNRPFCGLGSMGFLSLARPDWFVLHDAWNCEVGRSYPLFYQDRSEVSVRCQSAFIRLLKVDCGDRFEKSNVPLGVLQLILTEEYHHSIFDSDGVFTRIRPRS